MESNSTTESADTAADFFSAQLETDFWSTADATEYVDNLAALLAEARQHLAAYVNRP